MKYLIWDFDGTLAYRGGMWSGALIEVLDAQLPGHTITREQLRPHLRAGFPWHTSDQPHPQLRSADAWWAALEPVFRTAFYATGCTPEQVAQLAPAVRTAYCNPRAWSLYAETMATLAALSGDGWTQVILSNHVPELPALVRQLGLDRHIRATITSATTGYEKPHPSAFQPALALTQDAEMVWMIGDDPVADITGAAGVGIRGMLVRTIDPQARYSASDLTHVRTLVNQG